MQLFNGKNDILICHRNNLLATFLQNIRYDIDYNEDSLQSTFSIKILVFNFKRFCGVSLTEKNELFWQSWLSLSYLAE